jgi:prepilin peptidase CpaA
MYPQIVIGAFGMLIAIAAASDIAARRIANHLSVPLAAGGLAAQAVALGWDGIGDGLSAAAVLGTVLWIPWRRGWLGGGDLKLAVGAAAWVGMRGLPGYLLVAALVAGLAAFVSYVASTRSARAEMRSNLQGVAAGRQVVIPLHGVGGRVSVPAGAAFAAGALFAVLVGV